MARLTASTGDGARDCHCYYSAPLPSAPHRSQVLKIEGVPDSDAEVSIVIFDKDTLATDEPLGQVDFMLRDVEMTRDGTWSPMEPIALHAVTQEGLKQKRPPKGDVELKIAWLQPTDEQLKEMVGTKGNKASKELEGYDLEDGDDDDPTDETAEAEEAAEDRIDQDLKPGDYQLQVLAL